MGLVVAPIVQLTLADVPAEQAGTGSGLFNTVSQLGASLGVATLGRFFSAFQDPTAGVLELTQAADWIINTYE